MRAAAKRNFEFSISSMFACSSFVPKEGKREGSKQARKEEGKMERRTVRSKKGNEGKNGKGRGLTPLGLSGILSFFSIISWLSQRAMFQAEILKKERLSIFETLFLLRDQ